LGWWVRWAEGTIFDGVEIPQWEWAILRTDMGQPIVMNGEFWHRCVKMCNMIKLLFWVVSGAGRGNEQVLVCTGFFNALVVKKHIRVV